MEGQTDDIPSTGHNTEYYFRPFITASLDVQKWSLSVRLLVRYDRFHLP